MAKQYNNYRNEYRQGGNRRQPTIEKDFYNPYSFIPLSEDVYFLDKNEVEELKNAHDIPFENGMSGKIRIDFETITPTCVRYADGDNVNIDGRYFIPGTSIKGMIRNVMEIITKSNFRNGIANSRYSMRDLRSNDYELKANDKPQRSGFLIQLDNRFFIVECKSEPWKYKDIEDEEGIRGLKMCKSVADKYKKLSSHIIEYEDGTYSMWFFSGFMNNKEHEFLFDVPTNFENSRLIPLEENEYQDFRFIHEIETDNASWKFWKRKLKNYNSIEAINKDGYRGIVPCFFRTFIKNGKRCVRDLGFSFLYRQPYPQKMHDFLPSSHSEGGVDLVQSMFGYVNKNEVLKGRVQFTSAFIEEPRFESEQTFILGSPKPTFYPFYIEQNGENKLNTYFSSKANIAGYKRYLVHTTAEAGNIPPSRVTTTFRPLAAGVKFSTTLYFHNLRDYELGALLAAITFCQRQQTCFHSLGFAKPYGYGKLLVSNLELEFSGNRRQPQELYKSFYFKMCEKLKIKDTTSYLLGLKDLFTLSEGIYQDKPIRYPDMNKKEFNAIKNQKYSLKDFSPKI